MVSCEGEADVGKRLRLGVCEDLCSTPATSALSDIHQSNALPRPGREMVVNSCYARTSQSNNASLRVELKQTRPKARPPTQPPTEGGKSWKRRTWGSSGSLTTSYCLRGWLCLVHVQLAERSGIMLRSLYLMPTVHLKLWRDNSESGRQSNSAVTRSVSSIVGMML